MPANLPHMQCISENASVAVRLLLWACPNLERLALVHCVRGADAPLINGAHSIDSHPQLHTLHLLRSRAGWQLPHLPSLTTLLIDGACADGGVQDTVHQVGSQLTRLRLGHVRQLSTLVPCMPHLTYNLQRLELPSLGLTDELLTTCHSLLPGLRRVEVCRLSLRRSCVDVDCSWQELRMPICEPRYLPPTAYAPSLDELAKLPLAREGKPGLQRLVLAGLYFWSVDLAAALATVRSSRCRLAAWEIQQRRPFRLVFNGLENLAYLPPVLACFEPDSIHSLEVEVKGKMSQPVLAALGAALATGGSAAVARCHTLTLAFDDGFQDDAACTSLLPMLMATPITALLFRKRFDIAQLAAICCPESLAAVSRPIRLYVKCVPTVWQQVQAAIDAAGKPNLLCLKQL